MVSAWRNSQNIFSRPLFTISFRPEMLKFHPYSILTGDLKVGFVIFCVLSQDHLFYFCFSSTLVQDSTMELLSFLYLSTNNNTSRQSTLPSYAVVGRNICKITKFPLCCQLWARKKLNCLDFILFNNLHHFHWWVHRFLGCLNSIKDFKKHTANSYPMKTTGTGNYRVPALPMEKGCKNHKETLCMLWINPIIFTDCRETPW